MADVTVKVKKDGATFTGPNRAAALKLAMDHVWAKHSDTDANCMDAYQITDPTESEGTVKGPAAEAGK